MSRSSFKLYPRLELICRNHILSPVGRVEINFSKPSKSFIISYHRQLKKDSTLMFNDEVSLGYLLLAILLGFAILIYFSLQARQRFQHEDLKMSSETVWKKISDHAFLLNLLKTNMLYGVFQDASSTEIAMLVKDVNNQLVGQVLGKALSRKRIVTIGNEKFVIEFLKTWNRTAILYSTKDEKILARYTKTSWLGGHEYEVAGYGLLKSVRPSKVRYDYKIAETMIGTSQTVLFARDNGRLVVLPTDLPLAVRIFILAV